MSAKTSEYELVLQNIITTILHRLNDPNIDHEARVYLIKQLEDLLIEKNIYGDYDYYKENNNYPYV